MIKRIAIGLLALVLWAVFGLINVIGWVGIPLSILYYVITGDSSTRDYVARYGKAIDQAANVVLLDGHHKETISSHVGRKIVAGVELSLTEGFIVWLTNLVEKDHCVKAIEQYSDQLPL